MHTHPPTHPSNCAGNRLLGKNYRNKVTGKYAIEIRMTSQCSLMHLDLPGNIKHGILSYRFHHHDFFSDFISNFYENQVIFLVIK